MDIKRKCMITDNVKIICPYCSSIVELAMCMAVNGELLLCPSCRKQFALPRDEM